MARHPIDDIIEAARQAREALCEALEATVEATVEHRDTSRRLVDEAQHLKRRGDGR